MRRFLLIAPLLLLAARGGAEGPGLTQRDAMKKLEFMTGEWRGDGWMQRGEKRETFASYEKIHFAAGGFVLLVQGRHSEPNGTAPKFEAVALVNYDEKAGIYRWRSYTSEGRGGDTELKLVAERIAQWSPVPTVRYTIDMSAKNRWVEVGEFSQDGKEWRKFFEMTLHRVE